MAILEGFVLATICLGLALAARQLALASRVSFVGVPDHAPAPAFGADAADWPTVTVLVPAHNEEQVMPGCLAAMAALEYPGDRHRILLIDDRSTDRTGTIAEAFAAGGSRVAVLRRGEGVRPGKAAALADAMALTASDIVVLFDADYLPAPALLKELVAPFADPGVGATMGRVVPSNSDANLLTRLLDLERRAGYGADQSAREAWRLIPQFGGTVGGIRRAALDGVGGWRQGHLAEDTDLTFRLALGGWRIAYLDHARCYEEVPEDCVSRFRQVRRWAYGHNQCLLSYWAAVLRSPRLSAMQKVDGALVLLVYLFPACALLSTLAGVLVLGYGGGHGLLGTAWPVLEPLLAIAILAPYVQIMVAAAADRQRHVLSVLPLLLVSTSLSLLASAAAVALLVTNRIRGRSPGWDKTLRYRPA